MGRCPCVTDQAPAPRGARHEQAGLGFSASAGCRAAGRRAGAARPAAHARQAQRHQQPAAAGLPAGHGGAGHLLGGQPAPAGVRLALPVRLRHRAAGGAAPGVQPARAARRAAPAPPGGQCARRRRAAPPQAERGAGPGRAGRIDRRCLLAGAAPWARRVAHWWRPGRPRRRESGGGLDTRRGRGLSCPFGPFARRRAAPRCQCRLGRRAAALQALRRRPRAPGAAPLARHAARSTGARRARRLDAALVGQRHHRRARRPAPARRALVRRAVRHRAVSGGARCRWRARRAARPVALRRARRRPAPPGRLGAARAGRHAAGRRARRAGGDRRVPPQRSQVRRAHLPLPAG